MHKYGKTMNQMDPDTYASRKDKMGQHYTTLLAKN